MTAPAPLMDRLGLRVPVIQAPMAGGGDTAAMVAAVGEAGGLGFVGAAYLTPEAIRERAEEIRALTDRPFGLNLFAPQPAPETDAAAIDAAVARMAPLYGELGLDPPAAPAWQGDSFETLLPAALESGAAHFSFTFGLLPRAAVAALRGRGMTVTGTATTVDEAVALADLGVDAIVAQGAEAGGHRGTFDPPDNAGKPPPMIGTMSLVPQIVSAMGDRGQVPVIASGGIMDGRGVRAALALGAAAVQMGTAFLTTEEAGIPESYKQAILDAGAAGTGLTRAFSGRWARGIVNRVMAEVPSEPRGDGSVPILPFPLQNDLTRPLRNAARAADRADYLSLWAGQGAGLARRETVADLMVRLQRP